MKRVFFIQAIILLLTLNAVGQTSSSEVRVESIVQTRLISLNGGMRAAVGGKSRTVIPVSLPSGTVEWYYSFSTSSAGTGTRNLQLLMQLTVMMSDVTTIGSLLLSNVNIPPGSQTIDVYLLDQQNVSPFLQKNGSLFYYNIEGSVTATKQGIVQVKSVNSPVYLGIINPSSLNGVDITIEVVALVRN